MASTIGDDGCPKEGSVPPEQGASMVGDLDADELAARQASRARRQRLVTVTPGSQSLMDRFVAPTNLHGLQQMATERGLCSRPVPMRYTNLATCQTEIIDQRCNSIRESKCPGCAARAKRLRALQCRSGWFRDSEPVQVTAPTSEQVAALLTRAQLEYARVDAVNRSLWNDVAGIDADIVMLEEQVSVLGLRGRITTPPDHTAAIAAAVGVDLVDAATGQLTLPLDLGTGSATGSDTAGSVGLIDAWDPGGAHPMPVPPPPRRVRSTRRRQDAPDLPRRKVEARTVGRTFTSPEGKVFRPSMFVTVTLPSYGKIGADGVPADPASYDYAAPPGTPNTSRR
jgi:hypothetical protein